MASSKKIHNKAPQAKARLRKQLVEFVGGPKKCSVLETHAGPGEMRRLAYPNVKSWLGIDEDPRSPNSIHGDNRIILRGLDISGFNLFDIDAFGSPWHQVWLVSQRRTVKKGERIAMAITSGIQSQLGAYHPTLRAAGWSAQMREVFGARLDAKHKYFTCKYAPKTGHRFIQGWFHDCSVDKWVSGIAHAGRAWYFGAMLTGL